MSRRVVAIGGGHGLAVTLRAVRPHFETVTAVVATSDDGGSTGRLRATWDGPGIGDLRRCLAALAAPEAIWGRVLERRFDRGELAGHATGNLLLLSLVEELGDLQAACDEVARIAGVDTALVRVVPATDRATVLHGVTTKGGIVSGQVAVSGTPGVREVWVEPDDLAASPIAMSAIRAADLVVLGPGSLYTSVLAAAVVGDLRKALADTHARVVYVANLRAETVESRGYDLADHVAALGRHGIHPHTVLAQTGALPTGDVDIEVVHEEVAAGNGLVHDTVRLGRSLAGL